MSARLFGLAKKETMGKTAKQMAGLRLLLKETLANPDGGKEWLERARAAVPGSAKMSRGSTQTTGDVGLTAEQRRWLETCLLKEKWKLLSKPEQASFIARAEKAVAIAKSKAAPAPAPCSSRTKKVVKDSKLKCVGSSKKLQRWRRRQGVLSSLQKATSAEEAAEVIAWSSKKLSTDFPDLPSLAWRKLGEELGTDVSIKHSSVVTGSTFLLTKLQQSPGFAAPNPPAGVKAVRDHVDRVVREFAGTPECAEKLGYPMGFSAEISIVNTVVYFYFLGQNPTCKLVA